jgi:hypothetical protein
VVTVTGSIAAWSWSFGDGATSGSPAAAVKVYVGGANAGHRCVIGYRLSRTWSYNAEHGP